MDSRSSAKRQSRNRSKGVPAADSSNSKDKCSLSKTCNSNLAQFPKYESFSPAGVLALDPFACPFILISIPNP
jgi:hypothetical protein